MYFVYISDTSHRNIKTVEWALRYLLVLVVGSLPPQGLEGLCLWGPDDGTSCLGPPRTDPG